MSTFKNLKWHKIAASVEELPFSANGLASLDIAGKTVCISNKQGLHACAARCPHAGGIMADGYVDALGNIVCPIHRYKFSLKNGRNSSGEGYYLKVYPIETRPDGIYIGFEENKLSNWLK
jgi:nitrite reductase/ring-hydroxylating ferredoxin subunit